MILLTDEELKEQDANLRAGILAHHALAVKNGRDPTLGTSEALFERRKVAKAQLKKVVDEKEGLGKFAKAYDMRIDGFVVPWDYWQALLDEV